MDQPILSQQASAESLHLLSDEEFLSQLDWERTASVPATFRKAARDGKVTQVAKLLQSRLKKLVRRRSKQTKSLAGGPFAASALWSQPAYEETARSTSLAKICQMWQQTAQRPTKNGALRTRKKQGKSAQRKTHNKLSVQQVALSQLNRWFDELDLRDPLSPFERLLLTERLREAGPEMPPPEFFRLWRLLLTAMLNSAAQEGAEQRDSAARQAASPAGQEAMADDSSSGAAPDHVLIVEGELPWQMGLLFSEIAASRRWREDGRRTIRRTLLDQTDHNGFPRAALLERLAFWMAPLVRAREWATALDQQLWNTDAENRFRRLVCAAASLCRNDGRLALSNGFIAGAVDLLTSASQLAGVTKTAPPIDYLRALERRLALSRGGLRQGKRTRRKRTSKTLTKFPGAQSDWAQLACLRSGWSVDADSLVVTHHESMPQLELATFGQPLFSGPWEIAVSLDGVPLSFTGEWACVCWYSDADADYLELKTEHPTGVRIERQVLLARDDNFALFAETVAAPKGTRVECISRLPLLSGIKVQPDEPTRECRLNGPGIAARAFAPALPEERVQGTVGYFGSAEHNSDCQLLELKQVAIGGLYAPVVIDWHPDRRRAYADWRKLTVTEDGRVLSSDTANGCRLRIGDDQWVFYRSLQRSVMGRAVLGHHTHNETVIGRFDSDGNIDPILLVEYPEETTSAT